MTTPFLPRGALPGSMCLGTVEKFARQIGEADLFNVFPGVVTSVRESDAFVKTLTCDVWMKIFRKGTVRAGQADVVRGQVQINSKLFTLGTQQHVRETFLHEVGHLLADYFYEASCNHDYRWVRMARLLGDTGDRCHDYDYLKSQRRQVRNLTYACVACGFKYPRSRRLNTARYRCSMCGGPLRLVVEVPAGLRKELGV